MHTRRTFLQKSASLAAVVSAAGSAHAFTQQQPVRPKLAEVAKDAGMEFSLAIWRGPSSGRVPLAKQMGIYGAVSGVWGAGDQKPWDPVVIRSVREGWEKAGMKWNVVEGPPTLGEKTKLGLPGRDEEIENFIAFMKNLKEHGKVDVICYNWMPVISWSRTKMDVAGRGGALVTEYKHEDAQKQSETQYGKVSKETLWQTLEYFLKAVVPEAEKIGMNLSLHPDDPQVDSIRGISRIMTSVEAFDRMLMIVPSKYNGLTMCQGNFALMGADIPSLVRRWGKAGKINFVHFRNVQDLSGRIPSTHFVETFHDEGQIDMYAAMQAYYDIGFKGAIRPDHVPTMAGDDNDMPGYSTIGTLFAIGYMRGLAEAVAKNSSGK